MKSAMLTGLGLAIGGAVGAMAGDMTAATNRPDGPRMEFVQSFRSGADGISQMTEASCVQFNGEINSVQLNGAFLYVSAKKNITWFRRDLATGKLTFAGDLSLTGNCNIAVADGRLYTVPVGQPGKTMIWYDIEAQTGKPVEKGAVECPPSFQMIVGPDQKDLYVKPASREKDGGKLFWFRIGADGTPAKAGEVAGKGIGGGDVWMLSLTMTADGRFLYGADATGGAIACIERKPAGELVYKKAVELKQPDKPVNFTYPFIAVSPDGKWLYLSMLSYVSGVNYNAIFKRDPQTGDLACQETVFEGYGKDPRQFYAKHMVAAFLPDGSGGYWANCERTVSAFQIDPATGRAVWTGDFKEGRGSTATRMAFDAANGLLYAAGGGNLFVIRTERLPAGGRPAAGESVKSATK